MCGPERAIREKMQMSGFFLRIVDWPMVETINTNFVLNFGSQRLSIFVGEARKKVAFIFFPQFVNVLEAG